jgi:hypothetical protein
VVVGLLRAYRHDRVGRPRDRQGGHHAHGA